MVIDDVEAATELFTRVADGLTDTQLRGPSCLPGWTRAHVIAHVALNAEGFVAVADVPDDQRPALMYPGGVAERDHDIVVLSRASRSELLQRLRVAASRFLMAWTTGPSNRDCATAAGHPLFSSGSVLQRRMRELQVHLVDLDVEGVGIDDWLPAFVDADLSLQWPTVLQRTSVQVAISDEYGKLWEAGPTVERSMRIVVPRRRLLGWVLDRVVIDGLPELEPWSNRSKWEWTRPAS